jgi:hypothetical protein
MVMLNIAPTVKGLKMKIGNDKEEFPLEEDWEDEYMEYELGR